LYRKTSDTKTLCLQTCTTYERDEKTLAFFKKYWAKYKWLFILSVACVACEAVCDLFQPQVMSRLIDNGAVTGDLGYVLRTGLLMLSITGVGALCAFTRNISASRASQGFGMDLRHDLFAKIQSLSVEDMDKFEGGSLVTRMTNDVTQLQNFINGIMRIFFKAPLMCIGGIIMAATLNFHTIPIILPIVALAFFVIVISMRMSYSRFAQVQKAIDKLNTMMREYLSGIRLVKAFRRFEAEEKRFSEANDRLTDNTVRANRIIAVFSPCMSLFVNLGIAAILFFGARWVDMGTMRVGQIMAFITYMTQIMNSLTMISNILNMFVRVKTSNDRICEVMASETQEIMQVLQHDQLPSEFTGAHIVFEGVGFEYQSSTGQAALSDLNFHVDRGETLGVIGPTGSGKSTMAALLMRFYNTSHGEIRVDGQAINEIPRTPFGNGSLSCPRPLCSLPAR